MDVDSRGTYFSTDCMERTQNINIDRFWSQYPLKAFSDRPISARGMMCSAETVQTSPTLEQLPEPWPYLRARELWTSY